MALTQERPLSDVHAHHVLPIKYKTYFETRGLKIDDPKFISWWPKSDHLKNAKEYNEFWELITRKDLSQEEILEQARFIMAKYNIKVNF